MAEVIKRHSGGFKQSHALPVGIDNIKINTYKYKQNQRFSFNKGTLISAFNLYDMAAAVWGW